MKAQNADPKRNASALRIRFFIISPCRLVSDHDHCARALISLEVFSVVTEQFYRDRKIGHKLNFVGNILRNLIVCP